MSVEHHLNEIIERHIVFLNKYLDKIGVKIKSLLFNFKKELNKLKKIVGMNIHFLQILEFTDQRFEKIFKAGYHLEKSSLIEYYDKRNEHARYAHAIKLFELELDESIRETIKYINELIGENNKNEKPEIPKFELEFGFLDSEVINIEKKNYDYEFSKLYEDHPIWGINFFKAEFKDDPLILDELLNMELCSQSMNEYYCSYEYLRHLLIEQAFLTH